MGYDSTSIRKIIRRYDDGEIILPAIQRNYVWQESQIIALFDSLMKGYPVGTFLFWEVKDDELSRFVFNKFLSDIDTIDKKLRGPEIDDESGTFLSVLDGQQRITSLLVGLKGSYRSKVKKERKVNGDHPKRVLCVDPLFIPKDSSEFYDFRFLSHSEIDEPLEGKWWVQLSDVLSVKGADGVYSTFIDDRVSKGLIQGPEISSAMANLTALVNIINDESILSFYTASDRSVEDVVKIFERVNNNGKAVSGVDLMLSLATVAAGDKKEDMQSRIEESIRRVSTAVPSSNSFVPDKAFILTACLLAIQAESLSTSSVKNFEPKKIAKIYSIWDDVIDAICNAAVYVDLLGFDGKKLRKNYMHPVVHYFYRLAQKSGPINAANHYSSLKSPNARHDREAITQWLIRALVNNVFADGTGATLKRIGKVIDDYFNVAVNPSFPLALLRQNAGNRSLEVTEAVIEEKVFALGSKDNETLPLLTLLFNGGIQKKYEIDHMWPQSKMDTRRHIEECDSSLSSGKIEYFLFHYDEFPNFQILDKTQNAEKGNQYYSDWVSRCYPTSVELINYQNQFAVPGDRELYEYRNFEEFFTARRTLLKRSLLDFFSKDCPDTE